MNHYKAKIVSLESSWKWRGASCEIGHTTAEAKVHLNRCFQSPAKQGFLAALTLAVFLLGCSSVWPSCVGWLQTLYSDGHLPYTVYAACRRKAILEGKDLKEGPCGWSSNHEGQGQTQLEKQQTQLTQGLVNQVIKSVFFKKEFHLFAQAFLQLQWGGLLSSGVWASHCSASFCCRVWTPGSSGFRSCGTKAQQVWLPGSRAQA